jgi:phage terminase large subunit-like protein
VIPQYGSRITAISQNESIRGLRHRQYRPDLIVIDDVEDLESVQTKENRDKLWNWFTGEVMPIGDISTKIVVVGNLLHEDSLMMRLKEAIELGKMDGAYREYPLINSRGEITWPGKYPTMKEIEKKRRQVADDSSWYREYLLKFMSDDNRIVQRAWPQFWTELPDLKRYPPRLVGLGVDMAISERSSADSTALIPFIGIGYGDDLKVYILNYIVNKRLNFTDGIAEIKKVCGYLDADFKRMPMVYVEKASLETAATQLLRVDKILSEPVNTSGMSKQERLKVSTPYIRVGKVLFPHKGAEQLISQIVNFGIEKHDDLVDAFTLIVIKVLATDRPTTHYTLKEPEDDPHPGLSWSLQHMNDLGFDLTPTKLDMKF